MRRKSSVLSKFLSALLASAALCGCQTAQQQAEDPIAWSRLDCKRLADGPEMVPQFEQAKLICVNRAEVAGVAGTAGMPVGHGVGGAIAAGISQGIASAQIQTATAKSCMAEYGYMLQRNSEFEARCPITIPPPPPPVTKRPQRT